MASDEPAAPGEHFARRSFSLRKKALVGVAVGAVVIAGGVIAVVVTRPSSPPSTNPAATGPSATAPAPPTTPDTAAQAALAAAVSVTPAVGATGVALDAPVTVRAGQGRLTAVSVTTATGVALAGTLDAAGTEWTSSGPALAGASTYKVTAAVAGLGVATTTSSTFATLSPSAWVGVSLWPDTGLSVGVGQPVVLKFDQPIPSAARGGVLGHLHLSLSTPVPVGAYWFSSTELHLRPETYWPTGEQVSFTDDLDGWNAGNGMWGQGTGSVRFRIGDARISTANLATETMTVTDNGKVVDTYPVSGGSAQYPTMNGTHIVLDRTSTLQMDSATVGIPVSSPEGYDETVLWDVHISDSGEYVHAAPWSVSDQGHENVSHGCINLSTVNAQSFFNFSRVGDIVVVEGGPRPPASGDHGVMDWTTPWASWTPVIVAPLT
jgi:lipoprotein-anchoring transpeptidase ErfK/SrfK